MIQAWPEAINALPALEQDQNRDTDRQAHQHGGKDQPDTEVSFHGDREKSAMADFLEYGFRRGSGDNGHPVTYRLAGERDRTVGHGSRIKEVRE